MQNVVIFEQHPENFGPLALTRPVYDLRCGTKTLAERLAQHYPDAQLTFLTRQYLADVYRQSLAARGIQARVNDLSSVMEEGGLFIDGALLALSSQGLPRIEGQPEAGTITEVVNYDKSGEPSKTRQRKVYARLSADQLTGLCTRINPEDLPKHIASLDITPTQAEWARVMTYPWHLIIANAQAITEDYKKMNSTAPQGKWIYSNVTLFNTATGLDLTTQDAIESAAKDPKIPFIVSEGVVIEPGVYIDITGGPVILGKNVRIKPPTIIKGPFYAGDGTLIDGAKIREGCSIGPVCRVAGELEASIMHGFSNKHHDGFMGHAYVGEWVNWGGGTVNSDLKNDYSFVEVELTQGRVINSGQNKTVGCYMGDHAKTGLNSAINTGTVVGIMVNFLTSHVTAVGYIPPFCAFMDGIIKRVRPSDSLATAETVMQRRGIELTPEYRAMIEHLAEQFKQEIKDLAGASRKSRGGRG